MRPKNPSGKAVIFLISILLGFSLLLASPEPATAPEREEMQEPFEAKMLKGMIMGGKEYLLRVFDENGGAHKYYWPEDGAFDGVLTTTYTSTALYTLLKANVIEADERISEQIPKTAGFILSMQENDNGSRAYGGFHYSYNLSGGKKDNRFVTGTNAKTIFTLLELYNITGNRTFLDSAERSADFLLTMQYSDGSMRSSKRYDRESGTWKASTGYSLLYNGQALSAFSRIYTATGDGRYLDAAETISETFLTKVGDEGCYLGDDYRERNSISSSWVVMGLLDFWRAAGNGTAKDAVFECSDDIIGRQTTDKSDDNYGRWESSFSTSGNGWISEVLSEVYLECIKSGEDCEMYKDAILISSLWIRKSGCPNENSNTGCSPDSNGGILWNEKSKYIRTDSVAHALNGYINIFGYVTDSDVEEYFRTDITP